VIITRHNKPVAKLVPISEVPPELVAKRREIAAEMQAIGREIEARGGPITVEEILAWRDEGRR
jgi:antitoxin (DNA-binding transcriptional repressor) of toxin-antitoxin stability system